MMKNKQTSSKSAGYAKGGSGKMAGQSGAAPVEAGKMSVGGRSAGNSFSVKGGGKKMAGFSGSKPAKSC